jgi:hypothetical protein
VKSVDAPVLQPGKNRVLMILPPQRPGSYVLGVLTGHIGQVKLRSHTYCTTSAASSKGGPPDSDDYLSNEKPLRTVLEVVINSFLLLSKLPGCDQYSMVTLLCVYSSSVMNHLVSVQMFARIHNLIPFFIVYVCS